MDEVRVNGAERDTEREASRRTMDKDDANNDPYPVPYRTVPVVCSAA